MECHRRVPVDRLLLFQWVTGVKAVDAVEDGVMWCLCFDCTFFCYKVKTVIVV